jgi:hypothetical protein
MNNTYYLKNYLINNNMNCKIINYNNIKDYEIKTFIIKLMINKLSFNINNEYIFTIPKNDDLLYKLDIYSNSDINIIKHDNKEYYENVIDNINNFKLLFKYKNKPNEKDYIIIEYKYFILNDKYKIIKKKLNKNLLLIDNIVYLPNYKGYINNDYFNSFISNGKIILIKFYDIKNEIFIEPFNLKDSLNNYSYHYSNNKFLFRNDDYIISFDKF